MSEETLYQFRSEILPKATLQVAIVFAVAVVLALGVNQFRAGGIPLVADWSPEARLQAATGDSMVIPLDAAVAFYDAQQSVFVDARPRELYAEGHIPAAHGLVPVSGPDLFIGCRHPDVPAGHNAQIDPTARRAVRQNPGRKKKI